MIVWLAVSGGGGVVKRVLQVQGPWFPVQGSWGWGSGLSFGFRV